MTSALLALGSNLGDSVALLKSAIERLDAHPNITLLAVAGLYRTEPVGGPEQSDFWNSACLIETSLAPAALLATCHQIEALAGRERIEHWGPRTLDIDLIDYEGFSSAVPTLQVPHPRACERRFVLQPLVDIVPDWLLDGISVTERLQSLENAFDVELFAAEWAS